MQSILSLRAPSSGPESSRLGSAPCAGSGNSKQCNGGGPNAAAPPLPLSLKDGPATDGDDGSAGDGGSAVVSKSWAADAARPRPAAVVAVGQALRVCWRPHCVLRCVLCGTLNALSCCGHKAPKPHVQPIMCHIKFPCTPNHSQVSQQSQVVSLHSPYVGSHHCAVCRPSVGLSVYLHACRAFCR